MSRKSKLLWLSVIVCMLLVAVAGCGSQEAANGEGEDGEEKVLVLRAGHVVAEETASHKGYLKWAELIEERSGGKMKMEVYPNSQLGGNREMLESVQAGSLDIVQPSLAFLGGFTDKTKLLDLPYLFDDEKDAEAILDGEVGQEILGSLEDQGMKGLCWWFQGWRHTTANKEIRSPEDLKGVKIRVMENAMHIDHFKTLGANPIPMAFSEVLTGLQQGVIDAQENPYGNIRQSGFYRVNKYIIETKHLYDPIPVIMSKITWDKLTEEQREIIMETVLEAQAYQRELVQQMDQDDRDAIMAEGKNEIIELTLEERLKFREAAMPVYEKYEDEIGKDLIDKALGN